MKIANFPNHDKFKELSLPILGLGTIWMGRRWPANNKEYNIPTQDEISSFLTYAYESDIRMFDTAAAYGLSEEVIGNYFKQNPEIINNVFIATKWGENFDLKTEVSTTDHSISNMEASFSNSLSKLPKIDLLYIHKANEKTLQNTEVRDKMLSYIKSNKIKFAGASISDADELEIVFNKDLLWFDFLQTSAAVLWERPELIKDIFNRGIAIIINSPIRKLSEGITPIEAYLNLANNQNITSILTGTRNHLEETIRYFSQ